MIHLREHQVTAVAAIRAWADRAERAPRSPHRGARGTLVSATGSGKTITAAWAARDCFPTAGSSSPSRPWSCWCRRGVC